MYKWFFKSVWNPILLHPTRYNSKFVHDLLAYSYQILFFTLKIYNIPNSTGERKIRTIYENELKILYLQCVQYKLCSNLSNVCIEIWVLVFITFRTIRDLGPMARYSRAGSLISSRWIAATWFIGVVEQITVRIVQIMIQATDLAQIFYGGHYSRKKRGPRKISIWPPFFKMAAVGYH